jgi:hypothetical protein
MRLEQLIAEPQHLCLVADVAGVAGDPDAGWDTRPRRSRGLRDGVRVPVARGDRASLRGQLADELAAHARAAAGHRRKLPGERSVSAVSGGLGAPAIRHAGCPSG